MKPYKTAVIDESVSMSQTTATVACHQKIANIRQKQSRERPGFVFAFSGCLRIETELTQEYIRLQ